MKIIITDKMISRFPIILIVTGVLLPVIIQLFCFIFFASEKTRNYVANDPMSIIYSFLFFGALLAIINCIPFLLLAGLSWWQFRKIRNNIVNIQIYIKKICGLISSAIFVIAISILIIGSVWLDAFSDHSSSTAVVAFAFIPIYGIIAIPIGYIFGYLFGSIISRIKGLNFQYLTRQSSGL